MCGIAGYTHRHRTVDIGVIRRITASLSHRGPDQQGVFESRDVSLGAVRLKIIDQVCAAAARLSERRQGALVVFERETGIQEYIDSGVIVLTPHMPKNSDDFVVDWKCTSANYSDISDATLGLCEYTKLP